MKWIGIICLLTGVAFAMPDQSELAHITQDRIELDLATGEILFNDEPISLDELSPRIGSSYSVSFSAGVHSESKEDLFITPSDVLFSAPSVSSSKGPTTCSSDLLLAVLEQINAANLSRELVRLNLFIPTQLKRNQYHHIEVASGGLVVLNGSPISVTDLAQTDRKGNPCVIDQKSATSPVDYKQFLSVLHAIGGKAELAGLEFVNEERLEVEAAIYTISSDGTRDVLSAPKVNVMPGNAAMIRVVENATGQRKYEPWMDEFHQEDLANLGIRFSVRAQIIGDYIRVTGAVIITKLKDREGLFLHDDIPVASYTCSKVVVPIEVVFPPGIEAIEFPVVKVNDQETFCRVSAITVDKRGMTKGDREKARAAARNSVNQILIEE
ncbi:hypothetical protein P4C99_13565 [Pontiellaceae bacterium B1224]|nr:hypothetical protein [Pontiellaceae bacterium B1224]